MDDVTPNEPEASKPKRSRQASDSEVIRRVYAVLDLLLGGAEPSDIYQFSAAQQWSVADRHVREYIRRARLIMKEQFEEDRETRIRRHVAMRYRLFAAAVNAGEIKAAHGILADLATLEGLYPAKQATLTVEAKQEMITTRCEEDVTKRLLRIRREIDDVTDEAV